MSDVSAKAPQPASRFRTPTSVLYVPAWLSLRWTGGRRGDHTWPFVVEVPLLVISTVWFALRLLCYPFLVLSRTFALPFRSRPLD
jgi:hypothetical protein